ncbi:DUF6879 family protein [Parafrankia discariae]|uniref:DUF6879 family protein n=1 Tax=Parafrankia discariae TaxID=365528 RepID=UPI0012B67E7B|nr:DUF6879 family protein [Parafrankia discariae]
MGPTSEASRGLGCIPGVAEEPDPPFGELLRACSSSAVHLEMRDSYDVGDPWFQAWCAGDHEEFQRRLAPRPWLDLIAEVTGRGVEVRRVRVVSEPVSDYIRFEHATTASNVAAGEQVRWLPRHLATGLLLPANDFWVFDGRQAQFNYFSGRGEFLETRLSPDPVIAARCARAFEAAWERSVPHQEYDLAPA